MHCHCGTNNRAPRWTFTDQWIKLVGKRLFLYHSNGPSPPTRHHISPTLNRLEQKCFTWCDHLSNVLISECTIKKVFGVLVSSRLPRSTRYGAGAEWNEEKPWTYCFSAWSHRKLIVISPLIDKLVGYSQVRVRYTKWLCIGEFPLFEVWSMH